VDRIFTEAIQRWQDCQQVEVFLGQIEGSWGYEESAELMEGSQK